MRIYLLQLTAVYVCQQLIVVAECMAKFKVV